MTEGVVEHPKCNFCGSDREVEITSYKRWNDLPADHAYLCRVCRTTGADGFFFKDFSSHGQAALVSILSAATNEILDALDERMEELKGRMDNVQTP
jgi:hypothetical protein